MDDQVLEQADAESGDVPTSQDGQVFVSVPVIPTERTAATETTNDESKKKRISDAEWQERTEKAQEGEELRQTAKETLGVEKPEDLAGIAQQLKELKEENQRKDWEIDHPIVRQEKYKDDWARVNRQEKYKALDFDERWAIINRERGPSLNKELQDRATTDRSSVPLASRGSAPKSGLSEEEAHIARLGGLTEDDFKKAGLL